jgi:hypothetical protein
MAERYAPVPARAAGIRNLAGRDLRVLIAIAAHADRSGMIESYEHGVWLIDLAPLGDPRLVPSAVATVLGLESATYRGS